MNLKYDLHIHTALSSCGDNSMTPNNIVNMALLNELDVIAITDHNTCENVNAVIEAALDLELIVIPGMEIQTREEIHVVCLFLDINSVYSMQKLVYENLPVFRNNKKVFGEQLIFDSNDGIIGNLDKLTMFATNLSIDEVLEHVKLNNGIAYPAHVDRPSYSIISNLGMIPDNLDISMIEVSRFADYNDYKKKYEEYFVIQSSDAHELGYIGICNQTLKAEEKTIQSVFKALRSI